MRLIITVVLPLSAGQITRCLASARKCNAVVSIGPKLLATFLGLKFLTASSTSLIKALTSGEIDATGGCQCDGLYKERNLSGVLDLP